MRSKKTFFLQFSLFQSTTISSFESCTISGWKETRHVHRIVRREIAAQNKKHNSWDVRSFRFANRVSPILSYSLVSRRTFSFDLGDFSLLVRLKSLDRWESQRQSLRDSVVNTQHRVFIDEFRSRFFSDFVRVVAVNTLKVSCLLIRLLLKSLVPSR